jgi:hypothetical protein
MTGAGASGVRRGDDESVVAAPVLVKWLGLAAAPTFAAMALSTVFLDRNLPNALCSATGHLWPDGMAPMYLLMGIFHSAPWLKLMSRRRNVAGPSRPNATVTLFAGVDRSSCIQTTEQMR